MDKKTKENNESLVIEQKLNRITNRIKKTRKNFKIAQKEAAEFEEIHKLLESTENDSIIDTTEKSSSEVFDKKSLESSVIPLSSPGIKVFKDDLLYSLFDEDSLCLKNFVDSNEKCEVFGKDNSIPSEELFRKLIGYHVAETLMPEEKCAPISLYVLYLMSVHQNPTFVSACFDFLKFCPFHPRPEDIFPIFVNFGAELRDFGLCQETLLQFPRKNVENLFKHPKFPYFNLEMVGQIFIYYVTQDLIVINSETKSLIKALAKITLDPKVRSGALLPTYSTLLSVLCVKAKEDFTGTEIVRWLHFKEENLLNQLEICRIISKPICVDIHRILVLKTISTILKQRCPPAKEPIKIDYLKSVLKKLKSKKVSLLEFYSLLQLVNGSLPGVTATVEDSVELNAILTCLEGKISQTEDSVDLIRLKLEIAKVRNLVANSINNRFIADESSKASPARKTKCSN